MEGHTRPDQGPAASEADTPSPATGHSPLAAEQDKPPSLRILTLIGALSVVVAAAVFGLWELFVLATDAEIQTKELEPGNPELAEMRSRDEQRLTGYAQIDAATGRYQLPIEEAMRLLIAHPELIQAVLPPSSSAAARGSKP